MSMSLFKSIRNQLERDTTIIVIRADQKGKVPQKPYATYKVIASRRGIGQEELTYQETTTSLFESRTEERNATISFNCYGTTHENAYEIAEKLRKWFVHGGSIFFIENNVAIASVSDVQNRTTFLIDAYDEKYGFDVIVRFTDYEENEVEYFDKVGIIGG